MINVRGIDTKKQNRSSLPQSGRGIFNRKGYNLFLIRSLTPPQAAGNVLAVSVQREKDEAS